VAEPFRQQSFLALAPHEFHRIAYTEWGDPDNPRVLVCVHGLTRNGRDFDFLARELASTCRVICPDVPGRGASAWLRAKQDYGYPTYCAGMAALLAHAGAEAVDWLGTSMGGLIGMLLAALPETPIRRLVLNDIGPFIPRAALERIRDYVGLRMRFASPAALEEFFRQLYAPFGPLADAQWRHLVTHSSRLEPDGSCTLLYDPDIGQPLRSMELDDVDLWSVWEAIRCPALLIRGAQSDVLPADTAEQMTARGPRAELVELPGIGHAPALMSAEQISLVRTWLEKGV